jgi:hypothetical protein
LSRAPDLGADMIVAGAYHHSPLRESLLGRVSRDLLDHVTVPVPVALRSAGAWVDLRAVGAGYVGAETAGSRIPFPLPAKDRPDSQTLPFARDTYFFRTDLMVA